MKRIHQAIVTLALATFAIACGNSGPIQPGEGYLEMGTGEWRFETLEDGQEVELIRGAQGGYHVWASFLMDGVEGIESRATLRIETEIMDGSEDVQKSAVRVRFEEDRESPMQRYIGWPAVIANPACFIGKELRITAEVTDDNGVVARDERIIIPVSDDEDLQGGC